jgi:hypothetical protein
MVLTTIHVFPCALYDWTADVGDGDIGVFSYGHVWGGIGERF